MQDGVYNIDTAEVDEDAGYQLIESNDPGSADLIIAPPSVKEDL